MNCAINIISKTLIAKISCISWGVTTKAFTVFKILNGVLILKNKFMIKSFLILKTRYTKITKFY